ncbi:MAG: DsbA family protein [Chloroflexi bacterium]|nr:DsbA family protein [Chloroflexota bacterium]
MATTKRKTKQEETKLREPQEIQNKIQPAVTINIQAWATPIVGLVMLIIGLWVGYYMRPLTLAQASNLTTSPAATLSAVTPPAAIPTTDQTAARQSLMASVVSKTRHFRGDPNAPVTMVEFGDFQCPFCGRYATGAGLQVEEQYIKTGKARFGFVNFAFLGDESTWAAEAAECAADQNKYWEYHDKLYNSQAGENQGAFNKDNLKKFAEDLGLDTQAFNNCLDSGKYTSLVQDDTQFSSSLGVQSTPTFLINGQAVVGAQPFEVFQQTIDPLLK